MTETIEARALRTRLPSDAAGWEQILKVKSQRTMLDYMQDAHRALVENEQYVDYLAAAFDSEAVEGKCYIDDTEAARMVRDWAKRAGSPLADKKLGPLVGLLKTVLRRYGRSRAQMRDMFGDEVEADRKAAASSHEHEDEPDVEASGTA